MALVLSHPPAGMYAVKSRYGIGPLEPLRPVHGCPAPVEARARRPP